MTGATTWTGSSADPRRAAVLNLLLPGGGLVVVGRVISGLLIGLAFTTAAALALAAVLLIPDDFSRSLQALLIGIAGGAYVGAQLRLAQTLREVAAERAAAERAARLREAQDQLAAGDPVAALVTLAPLADTQAADLLVAYRIAQAQTALGDAAAARRAWARVRALDPHGLFRRRWSEENAPGNM